MHSKSDCILIMFAKRVSTEPGMERHGTARHGTAHPSANGKLTFMHAVFVASTGVVMCTVMLVDALSHASNTLLT